MKLTSKVLAGAVLLLAPLSPAALAQAAKSGATTAKIGSGVGTVTALNPRGGTVTIKHGPIAAIGWPAMAMTFRASSPTLLKNLRAGQRVAFTAKAQGMNAEVTAIKPQ